jgi:uncharacterized small protein (DUF1192 family)
MSDKAKEQRKKAAEKLKNLAQEATGNENELTAGEDSDEEVVYYVDTKDKPEKKAKPAETKEELDWRKEVTDLKEQMLAWQEEKKQKQAEKEKKKAEKQKKEELFRQLTQDYQSRQERRSAYFNVLEDKKEKLFDLVKF